MKPDDFIEMLELAARDSAEATGVPASFVVAQAALESGWGSSSLATKGRNLFGVKADKAWKGDILEINTREYLNGKWVFVSAKWRKYQNYLECLNDHAKFLLTNPRYQNAFKTTNGEEFAKAIAAAGYATDPDYAKKVCSVIHAHKLARLDVKDA